MHRTVLLSACATPARPDPRTPVGYVNGRPVYPIAGGSGEGEGGDGGAGGNGGAGGGGGANPPKPGPGDAGKVFTQDEVTRLTTAEKAQGARAGSKAALEDLAKAHGLADADALKKYLTDAKAAEDARLSESERKEREIADREAALAARETAAAASQREAANVRVLARLGATDDNLDDAAALLRGRLAADADDAAVQAAADALKTRRPELFGPAAERTPPAPGGAPAPGMPRPNTQQPKPGERGLAMAKRRGHIKD